MQKVVIKIYGGLGNQLFCYACGYAVSKENKCGLVIDTSQQDNDSFRIVDIVKFKIKYNDRITFKKGNSFIDKAIVNKIRLLKGIGSAVHSIKEKKICKYDPLIFELNGRSVYLQGYWQSYRYFQKYRDDLLRMFVPISELSQYCTGIIEKIKESRNSIAIHIRRGDYVSIGCNLGAHYYKNAIEYMERYFRSDTRYFIFSDDYEFAMEFADLYKELNMLVMVNLENNSTIDDLFIMSHCENQIIANSSYSWWAAWLNQNANKIVICPEVQSWTGDFYPDNWIKIKTEFLK